MVTADRIVGACAAMARIMTWALMEASAQGLAERCHMWIFDARAIMFSAELRSRSGCLRAEWGARR